MRDEAGDHAARLRKLENKLSVHQYVVGFVAAFVLINTFALGVLWGEKGKPDYDHIAVAMTMFQTLFGIAALYGFWALRGLTRDRAEEVAEQIANNISEKAACEVAERIATKEIRELAPPLVLREVKAAMDTMRSEGAISDSALDRMVASIGGKEEGDE